MNLVFMPE
jgi:hypothetical protein